ncbi:MAG: M14 family zinc carboxypeptidase, partial [Bacteroidota bacterium]
MRSVLPVFLFLLFFETKGQVPVVPIGSVDTSVPPPSAILGYSIGERFTDYRNLERYIDRLVATSGRIRRMVYGQSYEHRPLQVLVISSPANLEALDTITSKNRTLADPRTLSSRAEAEEIIRTLPALVWLSYGVHGNEASSPEAAMLVAYQLGA